MKTKLILAAIAFTVGMPLFLYIGIDDWAFWQYLAIGAVSAVIAWFFADMLWPEEKTREPMAVYDKSDDDVRGI
jgi:hypothetical protein